MSYGGHQLLLLLVPHSHEVGRLYLADHGSTDHRSRITGILLENGFKE